VVINRGRGSFADRSMMSLKIFFGVCLNDVLVNVGGSHLIS